MKKLLIFLLCGVMLVSMTACKKETDTNTYTEDDYKAGFVADATVNKFLLDYQERSQTTPQGLGLGELEGEFCFYISTTEIRMLPTEYGLRISILGGNTQTDMEDMLRAFKRICQTADVSCTQEQIDGALDFMAEQTETAGNYRVSNGVKILAYTPIVHVDTVKLDCKIDLLAMNYLPIIEE